jgi:hypothetical protein
MEDLAINIILIFNLQMVNTFVTNNCRSEGFGMQRFENDLSRVLVESIIIFTQSSRVFTQSLYFLAESTNFFGTINKYVVTMSG